MISFFYASSLPTYLVIAFINSINKQLKVVYA